MADQIVFQCRNCGKSLSARPEHAGRQTKCPACKQPVRVPEEDVWLDDGDASERDDDQIDSDRNSVAPVNQKNADTMNAIYTMRGVSDLLEIFEDRVAITPKGVMGFLNKGIKGTKEIPFTSVVAVQFKEAGAVFSGYIQFTIPGGNESRGGLLAAAQDENTFMFAHVKNNATAKEIKDYIDSKIRTLRVPQAAHSATSLSDELQKLAQLREQGVLSEDEFRAAKRKLIG